MKYILISLSVFLATISMAQQSGTWNGKKSAVVLTYDDAIDVHLDHAIPALDSLGLKATFYLSVDSPGFSERTDEWTLVAKHGHELGNHTMYHPCAGNKPDRDWVRTEYDLATYSLDRIQKEILATNFVLQEIDGKKERTFAYPCGEYMVGDTSYIPLVEKNFVSARGVVARMLTKSNLDFYNVNSYTVHGQSGEELINLVKQAVEHGRLLVFMFHGIGGGHSIDVDLEAHSALLHYLKVHEQEIWIAPMVEVATYLRK